MTTYAANGVPKLPSSRPTLPYAQINPHLALPDNAKHPGVKYQVITRDGQEIVVGRVKIQTPNGGHAFVLRRFDTGAISQTTMFRAAFPSASEDLEKSESNWVKQNYDSTGANGGSGKGDALRLAGVWVRPEVAKILAPVYSLEHIVEPLINASPEPGQEYRRSTKPSGPGPQANGAAVPASSSPVKPPSSSQPTIPLVMPSSPPPDSPKPTKRRKETSPAVVTSPKKATLPLPTTTPRRSGRTTSPVPVPAPATPLATQPVTRVARTKVTKTTMVTTVKSDQEEEEEYQGEEEEVADVPGPSMQDDIAEQKELIAKLKSERAQKAPAEVPAAVPLSQSDSQASSKRSRDDEEEDGKKSLKFNFREPGDEGAVAKREIRSNRRISLDLEPQQKSAAWGALWFAAGLAAAATIPSFFMG